MSPSQPSTSHLALTCRTVDVDPFLEIGLLHLRTRGEVTDLLELPEPERDWSRERSRIAQAGIPFYGYATTGCAAGPVVFAASGAQYLEAPAGIEKHPAVHLSSDGFPDEPELFLGRAYYRCLAETLAALPDPQPWLPAMSPREAQASDCVCGGRGWYLDEEEETGRCYVARCGFCQQWPNDQLAGKVAYGRIEAGWPK